MAEIVQPEPDEEWLQQRIEPVIDPDMPIIDAHHHLWDKPRRRYLLDDLRVDIGGGHNIRATVFVEARGMYRTEGPDEMRPVGEVEFASETAMISANESCQVCAGIVGHANLALGARVEPVLEALIEAGRGRFRGVRHTVARNPEARLQAPEGLLRDAAFREGFARLSRFGLTFDAWLYHPQIPDLIDLLRAFPDTVVVLDHLGGRLGVGAYRERRGETRAKWLADLRALAQQPNAYVKLGGLGMALNGDDFHLRETPPSSDDLAAAWRPYIEPAIEFFGADRCMFESNFPVDKASCSYVALWNAFKTIARDASDAEKAALFRETAARVYRLDVGWAERQSAMR